MRSFYFDVGGVLIPDHFSPQTALETFRQLAKRQKFDPEAAYAMYTEVQPSFDLGTVSLADLCARMGASESQFERDWIAMHPLDKDVLRVIERLLAQGHFVGLATNFCRQLLDLLIKSAPVLSRLSVCCSSDIALAKPSHDFFRRATEIIGAEEIVFVDDREINIQAAREFGWTAIHARTGWLRGFEAEYLS